MQRLIETSWELLLVPNEGKGKERNRIWTQPLHLLFFPSYRKAGKKADCSFTSPPPFTPDFFTASTDPSPFRQCWKHWNMQPNQTMVGPIAKQCLEGLGWPPSLWSLETLVNAGIILGFNRSSTLPPPPTWTHTHTHIQTLKHKQWRIWT